MYKTSDFYLAVYIATMGYFYELEIQTNSNKKLFAFPTLDQEKNRDDIKKMTTEFFQDQFLKRYIDRMKEAKNKLYSETSPEKYER